MTKQQIRRTIAALRSPDDVAELAKMAQSDAIAAALSDDRKKVEHCLAIESEAEAILQVGSCQSEPPRYRSAVA